MTGFKVTFNQNVKLGMDIYRKGDSTTVDEGVCDELVELDVIEEGFELVMKEPKRVEEMTVPELKEYATENDIDLGEAKKRDDILAVIQSFEEENAPEE
ncbi:hypothetical protein FQ087_18305 [Sporosarcina sp. ANT_H38]|uniref:hypothetical protein n=1 Tax=Sporosarcina sp. ANT_H38 TaxID=2597358 RepID=UPI0011F2007F|nr:hypothetical protein [Sporosarcina sp. ANT_H38]KAA0944079.1 hypothetical protein FQ087_18305 [Sporosarcina sp. ANT_H38]